MSKWIELPAGILADERLALCGDEALLTYILLLSIDRKHGRGGVLTANESDPAYLVRVGRLWRFADQIADVVAFLDVLKREGFIDLRDDNRIEIRAQDVKGKLATDHAGNL